MQYERIREVLEYAIKIELAGRETYKRLKETFGNSKVVKLLEFLDDFVHLRGCSSTGSLLLLF